MTWIKTLWQSIPERTRAYAIRLAEWAVVALIGWLIHKYTGIQPEPVPFPVYVQVDAICPIAEPAVSFGWIAPTDDERAIALATIKANQGGLDPDFSKLARAAIEAVDADEAVFFWEAEMKVLKRLLPVWNQSNIGSCVSHGVGRAIQDAIIIQIASGSREAWPGAELCREALYGGSRVEIGGGQIRGDGSMNSWAVAFAQKYGSVFYKQYPGFDLTGGYSVARCREWGQKGCPDALEPIAKEHPIKTAAMVKTAAETWSSISNGYPVCIASDVGFQSPLREGFCARSGSWAHSMCVRGRFVSPTKGKCFVIQNSWGDYMAGGDNMIAVVGRAEKVQLPPGCFAITSRDMDAIAAQGDSFALSGFAGFPRQRLNWPAALPPQEHFARVIPDVGP